MIEVQAFVGDKKLLGSLAQCRVIAQQGPRYVVNAFNSAGIRGVNASGQEYFFNDGTFDVFEKFDIGYEG